MSIWVFIFIDLHLQLVVCMLRGTQSVTHVLHLSPASLDRAVLDADAIQYARQKTWLFSMEPPQARHCFISPNQWRSSGLRTLLLACASEWDDISKASRLASVTGSFEGDLENGRVCEGTLSWIVLKEARMEASHVPMPTSKLSTGERAASWPCASFLWVQGVSLWFISQQ